MSNSTKVGIKNSWSLIAFRNKYDHIKITDELVNSNTGETFKSLAFTSDDDDNITLVSFAEKCGIDSNLSQTKIAELIKKNKDNLQVVLLNSGKYKLCTKPKDNWYEVEL